MPKLADKVALITGAAGGQGTVEAELFVREGAAVMLTDVDRAKGEALAQRLSGAGGRALFRVHDASSEPAWAPATDPFAQPAETESPFAAEETPEATADTAVNSQITDDVNDQITDDVNPQITDVNPQITDVNPQITDLTDEQVDRIARRVVQLMSEQVVRNIAWEVIPDLAEMVVKERIRQLEAEA